MTHVTFLLILLPCCTIYMATRNIHVALLRTISSRCTLQKPILYQDHRWLISIYNDMRRFGWTPNKRTRNNILVPNNAFYLESVQLSIRNQRFNSNSKNEYCVIENNTIKYCSVCQMCEVKTICFIWETAKIFAWNVKWSISPRNMKRTEIWRWITNVYNNRLSH